MSISVKTPSVKFLSEKYGINKSVVEDTIKRIQRTMIVKSERFCITEDGEKYALIVQRRGLGILETPYGKVWQFDFEINDRWGKYTAIVKSDLDWETFQPIFSNKERLVVRTDSGCETGQVFLDLTCDCKDQLNQAIQLICEKGEGIIVNIPRQDGRGMGLPFKLGTLLLQEELGLNTVESAAVLAEGGVIDVRTYSGVVGILNFFGVPITTKIDLATNNPDKETVFRDNGYRVDKTIAVKVEPTIHTARHFDAKAEHLDHRNIGRKGVQDE